MLKSFCNFVSTGSVKLESFTSVGTVMKLLGNSSFECGRNSKFGKIYCCLILTFVRT